MNPGPTEGSISLPEDWADLERQIGYCAFCPKMCRFSCPTALVHPSEAVHPTGKANLLLRILRGDRPISPEAVEILYRCTGCLLSRTHCDHEIQVYPPLERGRSMAVAQGLAPEGVWSALDSLKSFGNPFGRHLPSVFSEALPPTWVEPNAQVLVFAGCATPAYNPEVLGDLVRLLEGLGVDVVGFLPPEPLCCGGIHLNLGDEEGFRSAARDLYPKLSRAKRILTLCPHCLYTLKAQYTWLDPFFGNRVEHVAQFLLSYTQRFPTNAAWLGRQGLAYHDPCYLGRYLGLYDPPRELLSKVLRGDGLVEFPRSRERAECCGGGGGLPLTFPKDAQNIARRRLQSLRAEDLLITTTCPWCVGLFREVWPHGHVLDLVSVLAQSLSP